MATRDTDDLAKRSERVLFVIYYIWRDNLIPFLLPLLLGIAFFLTPQVKDMLAGLVAPVGEVWQRAVAFGLSTGALTFSCWYWFGAMVRESGAWRDRLATELAKEVEGLPAPEGKGSPDQQRREQTVAVAIAPSPEEVQRQQLRRRAQTYAVAIAAGYPAMFIAVVPLFVPMQAPSGGAGAWHGALAASSIALLITLAVVALMSVQGRRGRPKAAVSTVMRIGHRPPQSGWSRALSLLASSPIGGWWVAVLFLIVSCAAAVVPTVYPGFWAGLLSTPESAVLASALMIGPLVFALAFARDGMRQRSPTSAYR